MVERRCQYLLTTFVELFGVLKMKNIKIKTALWVLLVLSFSIFYVIYLLQGSPNFDFNTIFNILPKVVSIDLMLYGLFVSLLWKLPIFKNWLVPFPNLNGTWKGHVHTTWTDPETGERPGPIPAVLTIKQSFLYISCVMRTAEMTSRSLTSSFVLDKENQHERLVYTYDSNPIQTVKERSPQHCGTMSFNIVREQKQIKLEGEYWTGRKTTGDIEMSFWKKEKINSYPKEMGPHPVSETRENKS